MTERNPQTAYRSKVDTWPILTIAAIYAACIMAAMAYAPWTWAAAVFMPLALLTFLLIFTIRYTVDGSQLIVQDSIFRKKAYDIGDIVGVAPTHNPVSAPAASMDRIAVRFRDGEELLPSPKNTERFIGHLKMTNPNIQSYKTDK